MTNGARCIVMVLVLSQVASPQESLHSIQLTDDRIPINLWLQLFAMGPAQSPTSTNDPSRPPTAPDPSSSSLLELGSVSSTGTASTAGNVSPRCPPIRSRTEREPDGKRRLMPRKSMPLLGLFAVKEPSRAALEQYEKEQRRTAAKKGDGVRHGVLAHVSRAQLPSSVPAVNTKWDGLPTAMSQHRKEKGSSHDRSERSSIRSGRTSRSYTSSLNSRSARASYSQLSVSTCGSRASQPRLGGHASSPIDREPQPIPPVPDLVVDGSVCSSNHPRSITGFPNSSSADVRSVNSRAPSEYPSEASSYAPRKTKPRPLILSLHSQSVYSPPLTPASIASSQVGDYMVASEAGKTDTRQAEVFPRSYTDGFLGPLASCTTKPKVEQVLSDADQVLSPTSQPGQCAELMSASAYDALDAHADVKSAQPLNSIPPPGSTGNSDADGLRPSSKAHETSFDTRDRPESTVSPATTSAPDRNRVVSPWDSAKPAEDGFKSEHAESIGKRGKWSWCWAKLRSLTK